MKKNFRFAFMSAIALVGAVTFSACSSGDEVTADVNPTYDGSSVRTDFAFNVTKASQAQTRQSSETVQETNNFLGMQRMYLLPFNAVPAANTVTNANIFGLGSLTTSEITYDTKTKKIYSLTLPIGTNNFLFYGTSDATGTNFEIGKVSSNFWPSDAQIGSTDPMNTDYISFGLTPISETLGDDATNIAAYLTAIAAAQVDEGNTWAGTVTKAQTDATYRALADLYTNFTSVKDGEARSGSAESVVRVILDLYKSAKAINNQSSITTVQNIATAICTAIKTVVSGVTVDIVETGTDPVNWTAAASGFDGAFPSNLNLPMGAAQLQFGSNTFTYKGTETPTPTTAPTFGALGVDFTKIDYPSELIYFDNSPLRATDKYKTADDFPYTTGTWDTENAASAAAGFTADWDKTVVSSSTRAVAMTNNVNYGVALFKTNVKLATETLTDNKAAILGGTQENQTDIDGTKFKVTGVLIGGQPATVGWNMINGGSGFDNVIYDKSVTFSTANLSTTATADNYTIVFDNYTTSADQSDVNFALEIVNGDKDFYGKHNLIPAGSTFYLVGKLVKSSSTNNWSGTDPVKANRKSTYRITNEDVKRIFVQDYVTAANITISTDALKEAYSTIPDLVSTETVFGLSVDLKWESGLNFNVIIGQ